MTLYEFDKLLRALSAEVEATRGEKSNECCDTCCRAHGEPCTVGRIKVRMPVEEPPKKVKCGCEVCSGGGLIKGSKLFKMSYTDTFWQKALQWHRIAGQAHGNEAVECALRNDTC